MSYQTILVQADGPHAASRIHLAARLAAESQAHLVGVAMSGVDEIVYQCNAAAPGLVVLPADLTGLIEAADKALAVFTREALALGVDSVEARRIDAAPDSALTLQARYADLLVLPPGDAVPYVVLHGGKPVLVVPQRSLAEWPCRHALLAWDGSVEAARAFAASLPLLRRTEKATVAIFNSGERYAAHGQLPGADMARYLARHRVCVEVVERSTDGGVGTALLQLAAELQADLLVMGAYGHSRLRELVLGGATREVLAQLDRPVLMAH